MRTNPERDKTQQGTWDQESANNNVAGHERARPYSDLREEEQPRYVISIASQILGVHPQTLRLYEREGLIEPQRTGGKIRLYSENDIERVRCIMRLTNDLGVNLAGADAILNMRERMMQLRDEIERIQMQMEAELEELRRELDIEE